MKGIILSLVAFAALIVALQSCGTSPSSGVLGGAGDVASAVVDSAPVGVSAFRNCQPLPGRGIDAGIEGDAYEAPAFDDDAAIQRVGSPSSMHYGQFFIGGRSETSINLAYHRKAIKSVAAAGYVLRTCLGVQTAGDLGLGLVLSYPGLSEPLKCSAHVLIGSQDGNGNVTARVREKFITIGGGQRRGTQAIALEFPVDPGAAAQVGLNVGFAVACASPDPSVLDRVTVSWQLRRPGEGSLHEVTADQFYLPR